MSSQIKREVRKRCGFGCVVCGMPLYEYHHMEEWSKVKAHVANDITLLCDFHHKQVSNNLLDCQKVIDANTCPYNMANGISGKMPISYSGNKCKIVMGSNSWEAELKSEEDYLHAIMVNGVNILGFRIEDSHLLISLNMFDRLNNRVLEIIDNELCYCIHRWDIELIKNRLTIFNSQKEKAIAIMFNPPSEIILVNANIYCDGYRISTNEGIVNIAKEEMLFSAYENNISVGSKVGICIGEKKGV